MGCEVYGHENSPLRIAHAEQRGIRVLSWNDLPDHCIDFINSEQVFEHLADPLGALKHLTSALAPGGILKISVPDGADIKRRLAIGDWSAGEGSPTSLLSITPLQHVNCFSRRSLLELARRAGLAPVPLTLAELYAANADVIAPGKLIGAITRPLGRRLFASDTYVYFERA
jgi:SAM-dependent methyltransferase